MARCARTSTGEDGSRDAEVGHSLLAGAEEEGRDVDDDLVDQALVHEGSGQGRAALEEDVLAVALAQRLQRQVRVAGAQVHRLRLVVEDAAIGGEVAQAHDGAQRLVRQRPVVGVAHGQLRVVDLDGVGADEHRVDERPEPVGVAPRGGAGDPAAGAVGGRAATVEGGGELPGDEGASGLDGEGPDPVEGVGVVGEQPVDDLDAGHPQGLRAACGVGVGVALGVHHAAYAGSDQRLGAGAGAAGVVAGLEGDHGGGASGAVTGSGEGVDLGVRRARTAVEPLGAVHVGVPWSLIARPRSGRGPWGTAGARGRLATARG